MHIGGTETHGQVCACDNITKKRRDVACPGRQDRGNLGFWEKAAAKSSDKAASLFISTHMETNAAVTHFGPSL